MKELKNYLHLYLGAKVRYNYYDYDEGTWTIWETLSSHVLDKITTDWSIKSIQIQLRPLSDMTEEEAIEVLRYDKVFHRDYCGWLADFVKWEKQKVYNPNEFAKLLSKHFDLFGLIEAGLAIDKTKINNHE